MIYINTFILCSFCASLSPSLFSLPLSISPLYAPSLPLALCTVSAFVPLPRLFLSCPLFPSSLPHLSISRKVPPVLFWSSSGSLPVNGGVKVIKAVLTLSDFCCLSVFSRPLTDRFTCPPPPSGLLQRKNAHHCRFPVKFLIKRDGETGAKLQCQQLWLQPL